MVILLPPAASSGWQVGGGHTHPCRFSQGISERGNRL